MKKNYALLVGVLVGVLPSMWAADPTLPDSSPAPEREGYVLAWSEEFNYTGKPNPAIWSYEEGFKRNEELQWYQSDNANCNGSVMEIEGRRETVLNPNYVAGSDSWKTNRQYAYYTSSSVHTRGKQTWLYGRYEIRARLPCKKGTWPAIWTLGVNNDWPSNGEIDILEYYLVGGVPYILANFAWGTETAWTAVWDSYKKLFSDFTDADAAWASKFHVWRMDWTPNYINLYLDDVLMNTINMSAARNPDGFYPFMQDHYMLLNLALGGNGGDPATTTFPLKYEVDYVRVYQRPKVLPILGTNVALHKTVTASSRDTMAHYLTDSIIGASSRWFNGPSGIPAWVEIDLAQPTEIFGVNIYQYREVGPSEELKNFTFQYWTGTAWSTILTETNYLNNLYAKAFTPVTTSKVRLNISASVDGSYARISEIQVLKKIPVVEGVNIAQNKTVTTSSRTELAANLTDSIVGTESRWFNAGGGIPAWASIDFQAGKLIKGVNIYQYGQYYPSVELKSFKFQYWNGSAWIDILSETNCTEVIYAKKFNPVYTNKVRLYINSTQDVNYVRLSEIQVIEDDSIQPLVGNNVALNKTVTVSASGTNAVASYITDGDISLSSRWFNSYQVFPAWAEINLENNTTISGVNIFQYSTTGLLKELKAFDFQYWNGTGWVTLFSEEDNQAVIYKKSFTPVNTTKVRLYIRSSHDAKYARIAEMQVFGELVAGGTTGTLDVKHNVPNVYPNPATDVIRVNENGYLQLFNATGQLVRTCTAAEMRVSDLCRGLYLLCTPAGSAKVILQ